MTQTWYDDCDDGYPWWRITGQVYRTYFSIPPRGPMPVELTDAIHENLVIFGSREIAHRFGISAHTVAVRAKKLGYHYRRHTGHWVAPKEAARNVLSAGRTSSLSFSTSDLRLRRNASC